VKTKTIRYDHELTPFALKLVADVEARDSRREARLKLIKQAALRADVALGKKKQ